MRFGSGPVFENYKQKQKLTEEKKKRNNRSVSFTDRSWPVCSGRIGNGISAGAFTEAEESTRIKNRNSRSASFAQNAFYFLRRKHSTRASQPQIHHRKARTLHQSRFPPSLKRRSTSNSLSLSYIIFSLYFSLFLFVLVGFVFSMILGSGSS